MKVINNNNYNNVMKRPWFVCDEADHESVYSSSSSSLLICSFRQENERTRTTDGRADRSFFFSFSPCLYASTYLISYKNKQIQRQKKKQQQQKRLDLSLQKKRDTNHTSNNQLKAKLKKALRKQSAWILFQNEPNNQKNSECGLKKSCAEFTSEKSFFTICE